MVDGSLLMDSPNPRMSAVIQKFEDGLQQKQHKNDVVLNEQLQAALDEASFGHQSSNQGIDCLARGKDLMSLRKFTEAIEVFQGASSCERKQLVHAGNGTACFRHWRRGKRYRHARDKPKDR